MRKTTPIVSLLNLFLPEQDRQQDWDSQQELYQMLQMVINAEPGSLPCHPNICIHTLSNSDHFTPIQKVYRLLQTQKSSHYGSFLHGLGYETKLLQPSSKDRENTATYHIEISKIYSPEDESDDRPYKIGYLLQPRSLTRWEIIPLHTPIEDDLV